MSILLASCYLLLGASIFAVEARRVEAGQPFNALSFFNGAYLLFFVFYPLNLIALGEAAVRQKYAYQTWGHGDVRTALVLLITYAVFVFGYQRRRGDPAGAPAKCLVDLHASRVPSGLAWGFSLIGALALVYHVSLMGGVFETLYFAPGARTGEYKLEGRFLFVRQFCAFLATAFMILWAQYIDGPPRGIRPERRRCSVLPHLIVAVFGGAFVFYALSTYGRREFLYPATICFVIWAVGGKQRSWPKIGWLAILFFIWFWLYSLVVPNSPVTRSLIPNAAQLGAVQPVGDFLVSAYLRTVQGLGDTFVHFVASQHAELWQFGFLTDLWEIPAQFLPSRLLGFERGRGMFGETSAFILGRPLNEGLSGEEPLGMHGYLLVNFGYPGLLVLFYLAGIAYRQLDHALRPDQGDSALAWLVFMWVVIGALEFLREGSLALILKPRFSWWLAIGVLLWYRAGRTKTKHDQLIGRHSIT